MTDQTPLPPLLKTVEVPLSPEESFRLWTEELAAWWPVEHHSLSAGEGDLPRDVSLTPGTGGLIEETKADGTKAPWARVTRWEPGKALGLDWFVGRDEAEATQIMVTFLPIEAGTRVELEHGGFGAATTASAAAPAPRESYDRGWDLVLGQCYLGHCRQCAGVIA